MATPAPSQPAFIRKKKSPPPLSNAYQKAHRTYVLSAALFASWELIGIELKTEDKWGVKFQSPHAVPLILLVMIVYFGYRLTVEWMQCDEERRSHRAANVDFVVAHTIAGLALLIFLIQYLLHIRIADTIIHAPVSLGVFAGTSFSLPYVAIESRSALKAHPDALRKWFYAIYSLLVFGVWLVLLVWNLRTAGWWSRLLVGAIAILAGCLFAFLFHTLPKLMQKRRSARMGIKQQAN
jgi:hypothetical protein